MSDTNYSIKVNIKNSTDSPVTYNDYEWGSYGSQSAMNEGPNSIPANSDGELAFEAQTSGNEISLQATVNYSTAGSTTFQIQVGVIHDTDNSASIGCTGALCNDTIFYQQTDSTYSSSDKISSDSDPEVYFLISSEPLSTNANTVTREQVEMLQSLSFGSPEKVVDIETVIKKSCSNYSDERIIELFQGKKSASPRDIIEVKGVPNIDKVDIIFKVDFLSPKEANLLGIVFSELIISSLEDQPQLLQYASVYLNALKATLNDNDPSELGVSYTKLADQTDALFEELSKSQQCTIEVLKALLKQRAQAVPMFIKSRIDILAQDDKNKKKELESFMFNYLNDMEW
jgi:hypothetical protein